MTDQEIQANRDYIRGYYWGWYDHGCVLNNVAKKMGYADGRADFLEPKDMGRQPFVQTFAGEWARLMKHGLLIGSLTAGPHFDIYFRVYDASDPIPENIYRYDITLDSSGQARSWQKVR